MDASGLRPSRSPLTDMVGLPTHIASGLRPSRVPLQDRALDLRGGSAPRAPHWGRSTPPDPLQLKLAAHSIHRFMPLVCRERYHFAASSTLPVSMRIKRSA